MKLWLPVIGCLCVLAVPGHSAAVSTQDTLVVARSEDVTTETATAMTETEPTTNEPVPPIKLTEMEVVSEVSLRYAHTVVVARVRNPAKRSQEAHFRVLLPETAFISGFVMTLDGKSYKAYVKEKEEAKQIYDHAVSQGFGAAHVTAKARDSNQFIVSVNVEPSSSAVFNLTYEELLVRRNDVYNHAINLHPGALVPKLSITVHIKEAQKITQLRVPEIRTGNEIDATEEDQQNSKAVITRGHDDREATITFNPDLEEQRRLMQIYMDKSKESAPPVRSWNQPEEDASDNANTGVLGQFVVQYDVDRPKDGEILVNDGYFVHFFAPTSLPPLPKYVVFVLDTSGSMMDRKIVQLREAMQAILSDLNPGDYFSIVEFASSVTVHDLKDSDKEPPRPSFYWSEIERAPKPVAPFPANASNIDKAKVIISRLNAAGGTNIDSALDVAVNLIHKRTEWDNNGQLKKGKGRRYTKDATKTTTAVPTTTAAATTEKTAVGANIEEDIYNADKMKNLEPIIIFLTDGDPTVGVTSPTTIINRLTEKNFGEDKATIFSLAFGEDADRKFLRKLSLRNDGFMRHIYEAADAALQLRDFYRQVSSPLLADVKFTYPPEQIKEGSVTKDKFRTFYAGGEVVVAGQIADSVTELTPQVVGYCGVSDGKGRKRYEKLPKAPVADKSPVLPLERLWSYLTIKQLLDERDATDGDSLKDKDNSPEKKALALALKYEFVTPLTSLVVVKPNATNAVDAESVDKPTSLPGIYPQSLNFASAGAPGAAYFSSNSFGFAAAGAPAPSPVFASALSLDSMVEEEEIVQYDDLVEGSHSSGQRLSYRPAVASYGSYPSSHGLSSAHRYPSSSSSLLTYPSSHGLTGSSAYPSSHGLSSAHHYPSFSSKVNGAASLPSRPAFAALSTPVPPTSTPVPPTSTPVPPTLSPIASYRLQEFSWATPLLNATAETLALDVNGTVIDLKLTKESDVPKTSGGDAACDSAVEGGAGVCVYLTRCEAAKRISVDTYKTTYCSVNDGYAGVCCSLKHVDFEVVV